MPLLLHDPIAHWLVAAAAAVVVVGEVAAIVVLAVYLGVAAAIVIAKAPGLRAYANDWWTFGLGLAVVVAGAALRDWAIVSLGRYFRRSVTIEPGQRIVRRGPYRVLRHPSYAGLVLIFPVSGLRSGAG